MTLEAIYFISQVVAAAALVASLVFVGIQIRQGYKQAKDSDRTVRAQVIDQISEGYRQTSLDWANDPETYGILVEMVPPEVVPKEVRLKLACKLFATMIMAQNTYFQHQYGLLPDEQYEAYMDFIAGLFSRPVAREWWASRKGLLNDQFAAVMDQRIEAEKAAWGKVRYYDEKAGSNAPEERGH